MFLDPGTGAAAAGEGLDVRPHPHIGLATVTYLFEGGMLHRDSLGASVRIRPGDGQLDDRRAGHRAFGTDAARSARPRARRLTGLQLWVALPRAYEETEPSFVHHDRAEPPDRERRGPARAGHGGRRVLG